jgi:hypothetical protein
LLTCLCYRTHLDALHSFIPSFLYFFIPSLLHSFIPSFLHSFISSFLHSFISYLYQTLLGEREAVFRFLHGLDDGDVVDAEVDYATRVARKRRDAKASKDAKTNGKTNGKATTTTTTTTTETATGRCSLWEPAVAVPAVSLLCFPSVVSILYARSHFLFITYTYTSIK